jgi:hypothetical protein
MQPQSSKAVTQDVRGHRRAGIHRIVHIPIPDYSDVKSTVDCWREDWKTGGESSEVSCTVSSGVTQMYGRNLPGIG